MCRLLGLMGLRKEERFGLPKCIPYITWKEVVSRVDRTALKKMENLRGQHTKFGVFLPSFTTEKCVCQIFALDWYLSPNFSSLIARNENRTKPELSVDIKQILSSCYHPSSNQSKLQVLVILSHRVVNAGNSFLRLPSIMLSISSEEDTVSLWDMSTEDKTFLLSLLFT